MRQATLPPEVPASADELTNEKEDISRNEEMSGGKFNALTLITSLPPIPTGSRIFFNDKDHLVAIEV